MKPHPRIRKTMKWGGAAVTVLLVVVWVGSGWAGFRWGIGPWAITVDSGCCDVSHIGPEIKGPDPFRSVWVSPGTVPGWSTRPYPGWQLGTHEARWLWRCEADFFRTFDNQWEVRFSPVVPAVLALAAASAAWRLDTLARRRAKLNLCPRCNYDRTGLASKDAKCPECGAVPASV